LKNKTKFSVIIPFYNREELASEVINSILSQDYDNYEIIIVDDGSEISLMNVLEQFTNQIKIIRQENKGPEEARNRGVEEAEGDYIVFLDSDDLLRPWALKTYNEIITEFKNPPFLVARIQYFNKKSPSLNFNNKEIEVVAYQNYMHKDRQVGTTYSMMIIRKDIFYQAGKCRSMNEGKIFGDDFDFLLRLSFAGPAILIVEPRTVLYRMHSENMSVSNSNLEAKAILKLLEKERSGKFPGGKKLRFYRYAFLGGPAHDWGTRAFKDGHKKEGLELLIKGAPMIAAKILRKVRTFILGHRKSTIITIQR
jgi:glycosyltransferase involved in cell wall biosynthesis